MVELALTNPEAPPFAAVVKAWNDDFHGDLGLAAVDFRSLAPQFATRDLSTHLLHPYPAKLIPEIPHLFLRSGLVDATKKHTRIADPFCGSGTVLLEAVLAGYDAIGADPNPLARLISRVKTRPIEIDRIKRALVNVSTWSSSMKDAEVPPIVNVRYWYSSRIVDGLAKLRASVARLRSEDVREFMQACLSVCARRLSYADPRLSVPVKIYRSRKLKYGPHFRQLNNHLRFLRHVDVSAFFNNIAIRNMDRVTALNGSLTRRPNVSILNDARSLEHEVAPNSIDLVITSPPYLGAQKYIRSSALSLGWTDLAYAGELRSLEIKTLGREHYHQEEVGKAPRSGLNEADAILEAIALQNPLRAHIAWMYLQEMEAAIRSISCVMRQGAYAIIVVGSNTICGRHFDTPRFVEVLAQRSGLVSQFKLLDHIRSRGLMTKRNKTAGLISSEVVLCLRKQS